MGRKKLELHEANRNAMQDRKSVRESIYSQPQWPALGVHPTKNTLSVVPWEITTTQSYSCYAENHNKAFFFGNSSVDFTFLPALPSNGHKKQFTLLTSLFAPGVSRPKTRKKQKVYLREAFI